MKLRVAYVPIVFSAVLVGASIAHADGASGGASPFVYGKLGSLGLGVGFGTSIRENVAVRIGINGGAEHTNDKKFSGIDYDIKNKPGTSLEALADWYPMAGSGFRLTGGLLYANAKVDLTGEKNSAGSFSINDHIYTASAVGDLKGSVKFNKLTPYLGVGWESDRPGKNGWRFLGDAGIAFYGKGRTSLSASGAASNAALRQDVEEESRQLASDFKRNAGVLVSVGAAYAF